MLKKSDRNSPKYIISAEENEEIRAYRESVTDKYFNRRLYAIQLLGEGIKPKNIAEKLDTGVQDLLCFVIIFVNIYMFMVQ